MMWYQLTSYRQFKFLRRTKILLFLILAIGIMLITSRLGDSDSLKQYIKQMGRKYGRLVYRQNTNETTKPVKISTFISCPEWKPVTVPHYDSCAYVIGSGHMINSKKGDEIDGYDCVIRPNDVPTRGFEEDVGTKTTFRGVYWKSLDTVMKEIESNGSFEKNTFENTVFVIFGRNSSEYQKICCKYKEKYPEISIIMFHPNKWEEIAKEFHEEVYNLSGNVWISNGFASIQMAKTVCGGTMVYGMADAKFCERNPDNQVPYHYYGGMRKHSECRYILDHSMNHNYGHKFLQERKLYRKWIEMGQNLYFRQPKWH